MMSEKEKHEHAIKVLEDLITTLSSKVKILDRMAKRESLFGEKLRQLTIQSKALGIVSAIDEIEKSIHETKLKIIKL